VKDTWGKDQKGVNSNSSKEVQPPNEKPLDAPISPDTGKKAFLLQKKTIKKDMMYIPSHSAKRLFNFDEVDMD